MTYVLSRLDGVDLRRMGGKAAALAMLTGTGLKIPTWFVIVPDAFEASLSPAQRQALLQAADQNEIQTLFDEVLPTPDLMNEVMEQFAALDEELRYVAVRSSGVQEDGVEHSFAGQFDSFLFVTRENLPARNCRRMEIRLQRTPIGLPTERISFKGCHRHPLYWCRRW